MRILIESHAGHGARILGLIAPLAGMLALAMTATPVAAADAAWTAVYTGTYTGPKCKGIELFHLDNVTGSLTKLGLAVETESPSYLAIAPNRQFLYAVNEVSAFGGKPAGAVSAFAINPASGELRPLNQKTSGGPGPCHLSIDPTGQHVFVANYGGGSVEVLPILEDGRLGDPTCFIQHAGTGPNKQRQEGPHAHFIAPDPVGRRILACDLGLDKVMVYDFDEKKGILKGKPDGFLKDTPGSGPRHFVFGSGTRFIYVVNEMGSSVTAFKYNSRGGKGELIQSISTLPEGFTGNSSCAEIQAHPNGKFIYASNRGHDSIAVYLADKAKGNLSLVEIQPTRGKTPRGFGIDPTGKWLIAGNQSSDTLAVFKIDQDTGKLEPTGPVVSAGSPVCVEFLPMQ
jgi:6-phosphogluconolactonase